MMQPRSTGAVKCIAKDDRGIYIESHQADRGDARMAQKPADNVIYNHIKKYLDTLRENKIAVWRLYMFGSHAKGTAQADSDIDLAIFWDKDEIDAFDADVQLMRLTRNVNLGIEPHSFSRMDFDNPDPFIKEIIMTGERII